MLVWYSVETCSRAFHSIWNLPPRVGVNSLPNLASIANWTVPSTTQRTRRAVLSMQMTRPTLHCASSTPVTGGAGNISERVTTPVTLTSLDHGARSTAPVGSKSYFSWKALTARWVTGPKNPVTDAV